MGAKRGRPSVPANGEDELRPVTSVFADVVGSTSLGERLSLAEVKEVIGECVSRMCEAVEGFGGHVGAYMGDGIAAFFGLTGTREDDVERGARAALEIRNAISNYAKEVRQAWGVTDFNVRIGVNTGWVATGSVGGADPRQLALGDSVNVAARLQSAAAPGTVVVGPSVFHALSDRFSFLPLGEVNVRGRVEPVAAFELEGTVGPKQKKFRSPFVGRNAELVALETVLADLGAGRGQVCMIVGEAGLGKTRLLAELHARARSDVVWLDGQCDSIDGRIPFEPFVQALRGWLGVEDRSTAIETRVKLRSKAQELFSGESSDQIAYLARLLGVGLGQRLDRRLDGLPLEVLRAGLFRAYHEWLAAIAVRSPVVLAIDNFTLAAESTTEMAIALFDAVQELPILMLLTMRPEPTDIGWSVRVRALDQLVHRSREIRLSPLATDESELLVAELDRDGVLDARLRGVVVDRSEGNPLYIEELFAAIASTVEGRRSGSGLPAPLEALLLARIDSLAPGARSVLQAAAVLGRTFRRDVLAGMSIAEDLDQALRTLLRADVVREQGRRPAGFAFKHGLVRDAALSTLTPARFRELSARAAQALQAWEEFDEERDADALVRHYVACGENARAVSYLENLADRMTTVYRLDEAIEFLGRCLDELNGSEAGTTYSRIARKQAELLALRGQVDSAVARIDEAARSAITPNEGLEILLAKARWLGDVGRYEEAAYLIEQCLGHSERSEEIHADALVLEARLALHRQEMHRAAECVEQVGDLASLPARIEYDAALVFMAVEAMKGDFQSAEMWALRAQSIANRLGRLTAQLTARRSIGLICALRGGLAEGQWVLEEVYRRYKEIGFVTGQLETALDMLYVFHEAGALAEAIELGTEILEVKPSPMWAGLLSANLADTYFERGEFATAESLAETTLSLNSDQGGWPRVSAHVLIARCAELRRDSNLANQHLRAAQSEAAEPGHEREQTQAHVAAAQVAIARGEPKRALEELESAHRLISGGMEAPIAVTVNRLYGHVLAANGDMRARDVLERALSDARRVGMRLEEARSLMALGQISAHPSELYEEARAIFESCGCALGLRELDAAASGAFANVGD